MNILGLGVSPVDTSATVSQILSWVAGREREYVCLAAVHSVMECLRDRQLRRVFNTSAITTPDGMPLVWLCHLAGHRHVRRVYGPDLVLAVCESGIESDLRHLFYGGEPGVAQAMGERLQARFPGLRVVGTLSPPFRELSEVEEDELNQRINDLRPDIVWVGLGTRAQEYWMIRNRSKLEAPGLIGVGAAFDWLSGHKPQAPRWMQRSGLEWLFRLGSEPRRLWPRYREYPLFLVLLAGQLLGLRKYPLET